MRSQFAQDKISYQPMNIDDDRYLAGQYNNVFGDGVWKGRQMGRIIRHIPDRQEIQTVADVGCGDGTVLRSIHAELIGAGFALQRVVGYDIAPTTANILSDDPRVSFKEGNFLDDHEYFDMITLNDVIEHVLCPQIFLAALAERAKYLALHIPLDDRFSVRCFNQYNNRIGPVGHISFLNPSTALNLLVSAGLLPLHCCFTPGFLAPSGRQRLIQKLAFPFRYLQWLLSPSLSAGLFGGVSLAVLCRAKRPLTSASRTYPYASPQGSLGSRDLRP